MFPIHVFLSTMQNFLVPQPPEEKIVTLLKKLRPPGFIQHISTTLLETGFLYHIRKSKEISWRHNFSYIALYPFWYRGKTPFLTFLAVHYTTEEKNIWYMMGIQDIKTL